MRAGLWSLVLVCLASAVSAQTRPSRWVISPVVQDGALRYAAVARVVDPSLACSETTDDDGAPITVCPFVGVSCAFSNGQPGQTNDWALCFVRSGDFTQILTDPQFIDVFDLELDESQTRNVLDQTPRSLSLNTAKRNALIDRLIERGADTSGLTADSPLWLYLRRLGQVLSPNFLDPKGLWVHGG